MYNIARDFDMKRAAEVLRDRGFVIIPGYESQCSVTVQKYFSEFLGRWSPEMLRNFTFCVEDRLDGTCDADDGFLDLSGSHRKLHKDVKQLFHYRPELWELTAQKLKVGGYPIGLYFEVVELLRRCQHVYGYHSSIASALLQAFDSLEVVSCSLHDALQESLKKPGVTSRAVLRLLDYPPQKGTVRAGVHFDRSALTLHAGDEGGVLYVRHPDGSEEDVSPKEGEILAFLGEKARILTQDGANVLQPVAHGSRAEDGERRRAVVSFWHFNEVLWDAPEVPY